jgi:hypothetical protein
MEEKEEIEEMEELEGGVGFRDGVHCNESTSKLLLGLKRSMALLQSVVVIAPNAPSARLEAVPCVLGSEPSSPKEAIPLPSVMREDPVDGSVPVWG